MTTSLTAQEGFQFDLQLRNCSRVMLLCNVSHAANQWRDVAERMGSGIYLGIGLGMGLTANAKL